MSSEFTVFGQSFKPKNKFQSVLVTSLFVLFFAGIFYSFIVLGLYNNDIKDYRHTHDEIKTYAPISSVAYDEQNQRIYVFYEEANAVNVYNTDGVFQWSVSIPKQKNGMSQYYLESNKLFLIWYNTYIYDAKSGEFIGMHDAADDEIDKADNFENSYSLEGTYLDYNIVDVYTVDKDGSAEHYIVNRPDYYVIINPFVGWLISFLSGLIISVIAVIRRLKSTKKYNIDKCGRFAKGLTIWYKILIAMSVFYAVTNIVLLICSTIVILHLMFPIAVLFIVTGWIYAFAFKHFNPDEANMVSYWFISCLIAVVTAFFSTLVGAIAFV